MFALTQLQARITQSNPGGDFSWKSIPQGAATTVWAATTPMHTRGAGVYCEDCGVAKVSDDPEATAGVQSYAVDPARATALWDRSMEMLAAV